MKVLNRIFPFLNWFPMSNEDLKADMMAGLAVALILIPQSMANAQLAGLPPYYGLYASFLPGVIAALFGSSRQLTTGPVAIVALLTAASLAPFAALGSDTFIAYTILMSFMVGVIQLMLGAFRLGVIVNFISHPVIVGFTNAAAIIIGLSQLNKVFGISFERTEHFMHDIFLMLQKIDQTHLPTLAMGIFAFGLMWGLRKYAPKLPGILISVTVCIILSWAIGFEKMGGAVIGAIPKGLPAMKMPAFDFAIMRDLFTSAVIISLVGFMEAISIAKSMAARKRESLDPNQELVGQGLANIAGSFVSSMPTSGSFARSAVNFDAGAKSGMSAVFTGGIVLVTLITLTPLLYFLPLSVLAALIILAVANLVNFKAMKYAWDVSKHDGIASGVTFAATLFFAPHLDTGILMGVGIAISLFLYRTMRPRMAELGRYKEDGTLRDIRYHQDLITDERIIILRFDMRLYFANVAYFENKIIKYASQHPEAKFILIVCDGINEIDASGEEMLHNIVRRFRSGGVTLVFSGFKRQIFNIIRKTNLSDVIGENHMYPTDDLALIAIHKEMGSLDNAPLLEHAPRIPSNDVRPINENKELDLSTKSA